MMQDVIDECKKNDIILVLNLHHFDLPIELFQKYGGWAFFVYMIEQLPNFSFNGKTLTAKNSYQ